MIESSPSQQKILVTGGAGFLGHHLCRALATEGYQVRVLDLRENPEFETIQGDIRDEKVVKAALAGVTAVFHLAALIEAGESVQYPQKFIDTNITGSLVVLEAMRELNIKTFLFSSSAAVYGEPLAVPISEDDRTIPINPYGMTKLAMEALLSSYVSSHGFTGVALRYFNLYGPEEHHQPETHAIPRFIEQIYSGKPVTVYGNGQHLRDYIFIHDVVAAHLQALRFCQDKPGQYHYFNLSTEQPASVIEVVRLVEKFLKKPADVQHLPDRPGDPLKLYAKASKAREQLGWQANVGLEAGLEQTVEYFLQTFDNSRV